MIVCVVCGEPKPTAAKPSMCTACQRVTGNRAVARDSQLIALGSYVTFGTQRAWYQDRPPGRE